MSTYLFEKPLIRGTMLKRKSQFTALVDIDGEELRPGVMHICPKGSEHSIINTGEEDLVMLTIVVKK